MFEVFGTRFQYEEGTVEGDDELIPKTEFRPNKIVIPKAGVAGAVKAPLAHKTTFSSKKSRPRRRNGAQKGKSGVSPVSQQSEDREKILEALKTRLLVLKSIRKEAVAYASQAEQQLDSDLAEWRTVGQKVDTAATIATIFVSLTSLAGKGYKAALSHGDELKAINRDVLKGVVESKSVAAVDLSSRVVDAQVKEQSDSAVLAFGKAAADAWLKMNSPSFWASTVVQLYNGASWSEAVTKGPDDIRNEAVGKLRRSTERALNNIDQRISRTEQSIRALGDTK